LIGISSGTIIRRIRFVRARLEEVINMMLEIELPLLRGLDLAYVHKIKQLFIINSILPLSLM
jgi:hypothetical protein